MIFRHWSFLSLFFINFVLLHLNINLYFAGFLLCFDLTRWINRRRYFTNLKSSCCKSNSLRLLHLQVVILGIIQNLKMLSIATRQFTLLISHLQNEKATLRAKKTKNKQTNKKKLVTNSCATLVRFTWLRANQNRYGHYTQSDWSFFWQERPSGVKGWIALSSK